MQVQDAGRLMRRTPRPLKKPLVSSPALAPDSPLWWGLDILTCLVLLMVGVDWLQLLCYLAL